MFELSCWWRVIQGIIIIVFCPQGRSSIPSYSSFVQIWILPEDRYVILYPVKVISRSEKKINGA